MNECKLEEPEEITKYKVSLIDKVIYYIEEKRYNYRQKLIKKYIKRIKNISDMGGNILAHAKRELKAIGYIPVEKMKEEDPNKWIQENVLDLLTLFSTRGHSGSSSPFCI